MSSQIFTQRLLDLRIEHQLSQKELAKIIGVSNSAICFWETGVNEPKASYLYQLAMYFGVSVDYLLGLDDEFGDGAEQKTAPQLTGEERELLQDFRELPQSGKQLVKTTIKTFLDNSGKDQKMRKKIK